MTSDDYHQHWFFKCKDRYCGTHLVQYENHKRRNRDSNIQDGSLYSTYFKNVNQVQGIRIVPPRKDLKTGQSKENRTDADETNPAWFGIAPDAQNFLFLRYQQPM